MYEFINSDALLTADKALSIIFIILISLVNFPLIYKQVRKPSFYKNAKWMTILSLAIGDVTLALFSLVMMAVQYFHPHWYIPCEIGIAYRIYMNHLIHCVYGLGVISQAVELMLRYKFQVNGNRTVTAFALSSFPWIIGIILILPLCLTKVDYYSCNITQPIQALFSVSVLLPTSLLFVLVLLLNCMNMSALPGKESAAYFQQSVADSPQSLALLETNEVEHQPQMHGNVNYTMIYPNDMNLYSQYSSDPPPAYDELYMLQPSHQIHNNRNGATGQPSQSEAIQHVPDVPGATNESTSFVDNLNSNRKKEVRVLVGVTIVYFAMVIPLASISVSTGITDDLVLKDPVELIIIYQCLYWLTIARSCVTPLFMFNYSKL